MHNNRLLAKAGVECERHLTENAKASVARSTTLPMQNYKRENRQAAVVACISYVNVALLQEFQTLDFKRQQMAQPRKWRWQYIDKTGNSCNIYASKERTNKILEHVYISTWPDKKYAYPKQVEREVHEGMLQIAQNLFIWDGINTTLMQSATELDNIDA